MFCIKLFPPQAKDQMIIAVTKDGRDNLKVNSFDMAFDIIGKPLRRVIYSCGGFSFDGDCKADPSFCTHVFRNCQIRKYFFFKL